MLYDYSLIVEEKKYFNVLNEWINDDRVLRINNKEEKQKELIENINNNIKFKQAIDLLTQDIIVALDKNNSNLNALWQLMQEDYFKSHNHILSKQTSVRRGLGKLLVLDVSLRQLLYYSLEKSEAIPLKELPTYVFELGFFSKTLAGGRLIDSEIENTINLLGAETCEAIFSYAPKSMFTWINPLRNLHRVAVHVDFVDQHYKEVTDPKKLEDLLISCFDHPSGLSGETSDEKVWVFEIIISLLKAKSGKLQGYGSAQLAADTKIPELLKGLHGIFLTPFIQRQHKIPDEKLKMLAIGLSKRFKTNIQHSDLPSLKTKVVDWVIKENLQDRLIPYRNFEPLLWLLEAELKKQGKAYEPKKAYTGWINEYADIGKRSATTPYVKVGTTLIHWKSVSNAGKTHKKKELSARARSVKYQYNSSSETFSRRIEVDQLALIVDGTFNDRDLEILSKSGWNIIVYPDQIKDLVSSL